MIKNLFLVIQTKIKPMKNQMLCILKQNKKRSKFIKLMMRMLKNSYKSKMVNTSLKMTTNLSKKKKKSQFSSRWKMLLFSRMNDMLPKKKSRNISLWTRPSSFQKLKLSNKTRRFSQTLLAKKRNKILPIMCKQRKKLMLRNKKQWKRLKFKLFLFRKLMTITQVKKHLMSVKKKKKRENQCIKETQRKEKGNAQSSASQLALRWLSDLDLRRENSMITFMKLKTPKLPQSLKFKELLSSDTSSQRRKANKYCSLSGTQSEPTQASLESKFRTTA